jgi:hypothetical protein
MIKTRERLLLCKNDRIVNEKGTITRALNYIDLFALRPRQAGASKAQGERYIIS